MSKGTLNECGGVDTLFAECLADVPTEVHQVDTFECRINLYGRYLAWGVAQTIIFEGKTYIHEDCFIRCPSLTLISVPLSLAEHYKECLEEHWHDAIEEKSI